MNHGPRHEFLGMTSDCSEPGKVKVDMSDGISKMADEFEEKCEMNKMSKTPAADHLFKINETGEKSNEEMSNDFHTCTAKGSFFCEQGRPDVQTATSFLTTRVKEPDQDDWKKSKEYVSYDFQKDGHFVELKEAEMLNERLSTLQNMNYAEEIVGTFYSKEFIRKRILKQTDEDVKLIDKQIEAEAAAGEGPEEEEESFIPKQVASEFSCFPILFIVLTVKRKCN